MGERREGDWDCGGCANRNYAFRSFCNRCKQPRLLVDTKTPADSKWLPRIGDWICAGCTNNNYASREKCKKCGQPKEVAAMPAVAMPAPFLPTYAPYFAEPHAAVPQQNMNFGMLGNVALQQSLPLDFNPSAGGVKTHGVQASSPWPLGPALGSGFSYANPASHLVPKGWRNGDWMCNCGFHNYSSRELCKKCNASIPPAPGTKRLASEEIHEFDNKRLNAGQTTGICGPFSTGTSAGASNLPMNLQWPQLATVPALLGKGARQWREGDWMCANCNNHNFASRSHCNKCKTQRDGLTLPVGVA